MCGIYCHVGKEELQKLPGQHAHLLRQRGPDSLQCHSIRAGNYWIYLAASVLSLRGSSTTEQPLVDQTTNSVLCWNGEAWKISGKIVSGNDSIAVFDLLLKASLCSENSSARILRVLGDIRGPYALVFFDAPRQRLYFGRDCLGRRSLLRRSPDDASFTLSSVGDPTSDNGWLEVEADGIYVLCLQQSIDGLNTSSFSITRFPLTFFQDDEQHQLTLVSFSTVYESC
jgi:asparagine synthetase B (glutamine-hydrolysing)